MIWVLTQQYNDYNQHGEYFIHAWTKQPTKEQLGEKTWSNVDEKEYQRLLKGGGRVGHKDSWYNLVTVND